MVLVSDITARLLGEVFVRDKNLFQLIRGNTIEEYGYSKRERFSLIGLHGGMVVSLWDRKNRDETEVTFYHDLDAAFSSIDEMLLLKSGIRIKKIKKIGWSDLKIVDPLVADTLGST